MANFLRQKYKEKPQAWGSVDSVQRSLFKNAEKIGINPADIALAMPMWNPGNQLDYAKAVIATNTNVPFSKGALQFGSGVLNVGNINPLGGATSLTIFFSTKLNTISVKKRYFMKWGASDSVRDFIISQDDTIFHELIIAFANTSSLRYLMTTYNANMIVNKNYFLSCRIIFNNTESCIVTVNNKKPTLAYSEKCSGQLKSTSQTLYVGDDNSGTQRVAGEIGNVFFLKNVILKDSQIFLLSDNPYQLWQRQGDVYYSKPVVASGGTFSLNTSWIIRVLNSQQSSWHVLANAFNSSAWKIINESEINSKYKILTDVDQETAFKIITDSYQETAYKILDSNTHGISSKILNSKNQNSNWHIINKSETDSTWQIFNRESQETAWKILLSSITEQNTSWKIINKLDQASSSKILTSEDIETAYKIKAAQETETAWQILSTGLFEQDLAWQILNSESISSAFNILKASDAISAWKIQSVNNAESAWNIINEHNQNISYKIKNDNLINLSYKIINVKDQALSYNILKLLENNSEWQVLNSEILNTSWSLLSDNIPIALYQFIQSQKTVLFNQAKRTFIIIQSKKEI